MPIVCCLLYTTDIALYALQVVVALLGAVGLGEWYEAGALVFLFTLAEWLEERCVSRAARALEDILKLQPETALVVVEAAQHQRQQQPTKASGEDTAAQQEQQQAVESRQHQHGSEHCCQPHAEQKVQCTDAPVDHHAHRHGAGCCEKAHAHKHQASSSNSHCCAAADAAGGTCRVLSGTCCSAAANSRDIHSCTAKACGCDHDHIHQQPQQHHNHYHHHGHNHDHSHIQHHHQQEQEQRPQLLPMPVAQLQAGTLVLVRPGDKVPVDGVIEHGSSVLDESMVTGESKPVSKSVSDTVLAGTVNSGSVALKVRATAAAGDSTVARLAALMEVAAASKSKHDMAVERFAKYYTPLVVLVALLTVVVGSAVQPVHWREWAYLSLVVLVTGCPCALVISTPVASVAGLTRAARRVSGQLAWGCHSYVHFLLYWQCIAGEGSGCWQGMLRQGAATPEPVGYTHTSWSSQVLAMIWLRQVHPSRVLTVPSYYQLFSFWVLG